MCDEEDVVYRIAPKGLALLALHNVGAFDCMTEGQFNAFWITFEESMKRHGYIAEE